MFLMQGHIAQAADACTFVFGFLSNDHSSLTPSNLSIILFEKENKCWFTKNRITIFKRKLETNEILSESCAHWAKALHVLTSSWLLVPVSRLTSGDTPPDFRMDARLSGSWAHSANAPTVFIRTFDYFKQILEIKLSLNV